MTSHTLGFIMGALFVLVFLHLGIVELSSNNSNNLDLSQYDNVQFFEYNIDELDSCNTQLNKTNEQLNLCKEINTCNCQTSPNYAGYFWMFVVGAFASSYVVLIGYPYFIKKLEARQNKKNGKTRKETN